MTETVFPRRASIPISMEIHLPYHKRCIENRLVPEDTVFARVSLAEKPSKRGR